MNLWQSTKNFFMRILPPPVYTFNREINRIISRLDQVEKALRQAMSTTETNLSQRQDTLANTMTNIMDAQKSSGEILSNQIKSIEQLIPNKTILWNNEFERSVVKGNWGDTSKDPDFREKYLKLISGLDPESAEIITRIILRQHKYLNNDAKSLDLFTRAEQEQLRLLKEEFNDQILRIDDDLYAYKNYLLPIHHFESSVFYYKHGLAQVDTLDKVKGKAVVDVGGFIGDSVLVLSELQPKVIYTFEAVPENFALLQKTLRLNHLNNVIAENLALGAENSTTIIHVGGSSSTGIDRPGLKFIEDIQVPVTTLDDYVDEHPMEIGLIKVDIEGGEPAFLAGAKKTICDQKPILLLSIYHNAHDFYELKPLLESWGVGYRFRIHKPVFVSATGETLLLAEVVE
ncbi:MAG: FkbM family methyltransferase [Thermotogota bacterium]|nr:FkbM family methyltransferase [Thermotogota bacterium]